MKEVKQKILIIVISVHDEFDLEYAESFFENIILRRK